MPRPVHCAAVDLGATSGRVILGTWSGERLRLREVHRFVNTFRSLGAHDYWEVGSLWHEIQLGLKAAIAALPKGGKLASVGVDTWGVDYALVDESGRLVFPVHAYRDRRTQEGLGHLSRTRAAAERIYAATGLPPLFYNTSLQLEETITRCPAITDLAARCLFLPDYFNFLLSGRMENELSIASTSQLLDVHSSSWSRAALDHFRVPPQWLTEPIRAGTRLGSVRPDVADGLLKGAVAIAVPGHDTACAFDAMPADEGGRDLFLSSGTWSLVGFESDRPVLGPDPLAARVANERTGTGGYRPLTNVIGLWLLEGVMKDFSSRPQTDDAWKKLIAAAERGPAPEDLLDVTDPAFANPVSMKQAIDRQLRSRRRRLPRDVTGYTRLIIDSLAQGHANAKANFERMTGQKFGRILMVGGGSRNRLLCQATADAAGLPLVSFSLEGTAVGNLARQLLALRAVKDLKTFRRLLAGRLEQRRYLPVD